MRLCLSKRRGRTGRLPHIMNFCQLVASLELTALQVSVLTVAARHLDKDLGRLTKDTSATVLDVIEAMRGHENGKPIEVIGLARYLNNWNKELENGRL